MSAQQPSRGKIIESMYRHVEVSANVRTAEREKVSSPQAPAQEQGGEPIRQQCSADPRAFASVDSPSVVGNFEAGTIHRNADALVQRHVRTLHAGTCRSCTTRTG